MSDQNAFIKANSLLMKVPKEMKLEQNPIGPDNNYWIAKCFDECEIVIAAWGNDGNHINRADIIKNAYPGKLHCLELSKDGNPKHPLYLKKTLKPIPFL